MTRKPDFLLAVLTVCSSCWTLECVKIRLADGLQLHKGRVEIFFDDTWGTICSNGWDDQDATVVCRMLGYEHGKAYHNAFFGRGKGPVWLSDVRCDDSFWFGRLPSDIKDCEHGGWSHNNCTHDMDAGVWCVIENGVVLANGTKNMGRVEVYHDAEFGTICGDNFDDVDANVICIMSGFRSGGIAYTGAVFGEGSGPIWMNDLDCSGTEKRLEDCRHSNWLSGDCTHSEDVGVYCFRGLWSPWSACSTTCGPSIRTRRLACVGFDSNSRCRSRSETEKCDNPPCVHTKIRLRGTNHADRGRVEVYHSYRWGTICDDEWGDTEAILVCRMMGFVAGKAYRGSYFGRGSGKIWMDDVNCYPSYRGGYPGDIADCSHRGWGRHNCNHGEDAGVWCVRNENDVVLVNGSESSGRIEIYHMYSFGTICDKNFDNVINADVICGMVGYRGGKSYGNAYFGRGSGAIWMVNVNCSRSYSGESPKTIDDCYHDGWGIVNCHHGSDVGVTCFNQLDGAWSTWTSWTTCSATCDSGFYSRERTCDNPAPRFGGNDCLGNAKEQSACVSGTPCLVNGAWTEWSSWSTCTATCEFGTYLRSRECSNPSPKFGGQDCKGIAIYHDRCNVGIRCPIDGTWSEWTPWSFCSVTCSNGTRLRWRFCDSPTPKFFGKLCEGEDTQKKDCHGGVECPVDGVWGSWADWAGCTATCAKGFQQRSRLCNDPPPLHKGRFCRGGNTDFRPCDTGRICPVNGAWSTWSAWTTCTATCAMGTHQRNRACDSPLPTLGGRECEGFAMDTQPCDTDIPCPIHGSWSDWSTWSACSMSCAVGLRRRSRVCDTPAPKFNGDACFGGDSETINCNTGIPCPPSNESCITAQGEIVIHGDSFQHLADDRCMECKCNNGDHVSCVEMNCKLLNTPTTNYSSDPSHFSKKVYKRERTVIQINSQNFTAESDIPVVSSTSAKFISNSTDQNKEIKNIMQNISQDIKSSQTYHGTSVATNNAVYGTPTEPDDVTTPDDALGSLIGMVTGPLTNSATVNLSDIASVDSITPIIARTAALSNDTSDKSLITTDTASGRYNETSYYESTPKPTNSPSLFHSALETLNNETSSLNIKSQIMHNATEISQSNITDEPGQDIYYTAISSSELNINKTDVTLFGTWNTWSVWSPCLVTCGNGTRRRTRSCSDHSCSGKAAEKELCVIGSICPTSSASFAFWSYWSHWSECSATCAIGFKKRTRTCINNISNSITATLSNCIGKTLEKTVCFTGVSCTVNGAWGAWTRWSSCAVTCGFGTRRRSRRCSKPLPQIGGRRCDGDDFEIETCIQGDSCEKQKQVKESVWSDWSEWTDCSASCENGTRERSRECNSLSDFGPCEGEGHETEECTVDNQCLVDGFWSKWTAWTACSVTCGVGGTSRRSRECNNPLPAFGGKECIGLAMETHNCTENETCSVDGGWGEWSVWTRCSVMCGTGQRTRHRRCDNPKPHLGGRLCEGDHTAVQDCDAGKGCPDF